MNLDDKDPVNEPIVESAEGTEEISEEVLDKISSEDSGVTKSKSSLKKKRM